MKDIRHSLVIAAILVFIGLSANAQTFVSGGIYTNTTWTLSGSPYIVTDTVVVFPGATLTIQPGVTVKFDSNKLLEIRQANLIAIGTSADTIKFTSNVSSPTPGIWSEVYLNQCTDTIKFNYCNFKYAKYGINDGVYLTTVSVKNSNFIYNVNGLAAYGLIDSSNFKYNTNGLLYCANINHCNVSHNSGTGISAYYTIKNCIVDSNQIGINNIDDTVINCIVKYNQTGITAGYIDNCTVEYNNYGLYGCGSTNNSTISNNQYGIYNATGITNCIIDSNSVDGIYDSYGDIINNEIKNNGIGIEIDDSTINITKNIIENNNIGIYLEAFNYVFCNVICNNTTYDLKYTLVTSISLPNNYWCTPDSASTETVIYDGFDNISYGLVYFMPIDTIGCNITVGMSEPFISSEYHISIYPNPATEKLTIDVSTTLNIPAKIEITNIEGQVIEQQTTNVETTNFVVSALAKGMYFVKIKTERGVAVKKFIKE